MYFILHLVTIQVKQYRLIHEPHQKQPSSIKLYFRIIENFSITDLWSHFKSGKYNRDGFQNCQINMLYTTLVILILPVLVYTKIKINYQVLYEIKLTMFPAVNSAGEHF